MLLVPTDGTFLDPMDGVDFPQQCAIHVCLRVISLEVLAPVHKAHTYLLTESSATSKPLEFVGLQEPVTPSLTLVLRLPHL